MAYEERHNEANKEDNRDGHSENYSRNWGAEGETDDEGIKATRATVQRSMLTTLFASLGTPMLVAGDEVGRSQGGNNHAYCHDDEISWLDWSKMESEEGKSLFAFTSKLTELRRRFPVLRSKSFLYGDDIAIQSDVSVNDIEWWDERGEQLSADDWNNPDGRALLMRRATTLEDGSVEAVSLLLNGADDALTFHLPPPHATRTVLIDSTRPDQGEVEFDDEYELGAHGAALVVWRVAAE